MKKFITLAGILVLLINIVTTSATAKSTFYDVSESDWFFSNVEVLSEKGILEGYSDDSFKPNEIITTDQFIKTMVIALGHNPGIGQPYWAQPYIDKALALELIKPGEFSNYTQPITRAEMSLICIRAVEKLEGQKTYQYDVNTNNALLMNIKDYGLIEDAYKKSVSNAYELGIITGYNDGSFRPLNFLKRCEASTVIRRVIDPTQRLNINTKPDIKVGAIIPLTGQIGKYGIDVQNGFDLAVKEWNAKGGIDGKNIQLISYDSKGNALVATDAFSHLINQDQVVALLGPIVSSTALAVGPLAEEAQIPMITPTATHKDITLGLDYVYRTNYTDKYQAACLANYARYILNANKVAIIYNYEDSYSSFMAEEFNNNFTDLGGTITNYEAFSNDEQNFIPYLKRIKESNPEILFIPEYYSNAGLIATQAKSIGIKSVFLGTDGWDDIHYDYSDVMEGSFYPNHFALDNPDKNVQTFVQNYKAEYDQAPNALSALGYDTANIMLTAIDQANSTEPQKIRDALNTLTFRGVTGELTFDANGDPVKEITIIKIEDGQLQFNGTIKAFN